MKTSHTLADISDWFFDTVGNLLLRKEVIYIGLAGGTSYDQFYREALKSIEQKAKSKEVDYLKNIRWCLTDERVFCEKKDRNDEHIWEVFLCPLCEMGFSKPEYFIRPSIDSNGSEYFVRIPHIDISFFGLGPDGHTASLFPHHESLDSKELGFIAIHNAPKLPPERISLSPLSLHDLQHVCLFAVGEQKKEALANFFDDSVNVADCPAKLLKPEFVFDGTN